jgi:subtilisin-like proprotein convertase family protein
LTSVYDAASPIALNYPFYGGTIDAARVQCLYLQTEIGQSGTIDKIYFDKTATGTATFYNVRVYLGHTSLTSLTDFVNIGMTQVLSRGSMTLPDGAGWFAIDVANVFSYNNADNLIVEIRWNGDDGITKKIDGKVVTGRRVHADSDTAVSGTPSNYEYNLQLDIITSDNNAGAAYIFFGKDGFTSENLDAHLADVVIHGTVADGHFGWSVANASKVDETTGGYDDIIIGEPDNGNGYAYIFYGRGVASWTSPLTTSDADVTLSEGWGDDKFGCSVHSAGDINGDGYNDVVVGAYQNDTGGTDAGRVYIYYGSSTMSTDFTTTLDNTYTQDEDPDLAIPDNTGDWAMSRLNVPDDIKITDIDCYVSITHTYVGDLDVWLESPWGIKVHLHDNSEGGEDNIRGWYSGTAFTPDAGEGARTMAGDMADFNGQPSKGIWQLAVRDSTSTDTGTIDLWQLRIQGTRMPSIVIDGENTNYNFGYSVSTAGTVNNDNYADVIIGAPGYNSNQGRTYIYYGSSSPSNISASSTTHIWRGYYVDASYSKAQSFTVSSSGVLLAVAIYAWDANADSTSMSVNIQTNDVDKPSGTAISSTESIDFPSGGAWKKIKFTTAPTLTAGTKYWIVATCSDANPDGYAWLYTNDNPYANGGESRNDGTGWSSESTTDDLTFRAFCVDVRITGETTGDYFGWSVSDAGNVDDALYSDVIVGAPGYSSSKGRAYIFFGDGNIPDSAGSADLLLSGGSGSQFGYSVHTAGDVSQDGSDDVIVGAPYHDDGTKTDCGAIYIFNGGASVDANPDYINVGDTAGDHYGWSVSNAGNVEGLGRDAVIIGAPDAYDSVNNNYPGKVYICVIPEFPDALSVTTPVAVGIIIVLSAVRYRRRKQKKY